MPDKFFIDRSDPYLSRIAEDVRASGLLFRIHQKKALHLQRHGEVVPEQIVSVFAPDKNGKTQLYPMIWGFFPESPKKPVHSVRLESLIQKSEYWTDLQRHRCILPASYFLKRKQLVGNNGSVSLGKEYVVQPNGISRIYACGIYRIEDGLPYCVMITAVARQDYRSDMADRIPILLPEEQLADWLNPEISNPRMIMTDRYNEFIYEEYTPSNDPPEFW